MTPKFKKGDTILVNGQSMTLGSWPDDNTGPFTAQYKTNEGSDVFTTLWAGQVETEGEPAYNSANVQLVAAGDGVERSTLGDIHDQLKEIDAELESDLQAKDAADTPPPA